MITYHIIGEDPVLIVGQRRSLGRFREPGWKRLKFCLRYGNPFERYQARNHDAKDVKINLVREMKDGKR